MNGALTRIAKKILPPRIVTSISSRRWRSYIRKYYRKNGILDLCQQFVQRHGSTVLFGPFKGLKYTGECAISLYSTPALLGTYEKELHPWIERITPHKYERIVDLGSAEGYYAVGMALRADIEIDAYETDPGARRTCREMAEFNGVSHLVRIHSWCKQEELLRLAGRRCFILSDIEGFETSLFTQNVVRALAKSDIIIELHDGSATLGTTRSLLASRFYGTHRLEIVRFVPRDWSAHPELSILSFLGKDANRAISEEGRGPDQEWLIATSIVSS
jgi:hypothetical protein